MADDETHPTVNGETGRSGDEPVGVANNRSLDLESLKALAHPLRLQIIDAFGVDGPFTASTLAERLGESSGSMSYHLRQLAKHGFVREVPGKGTARERWWERVPGGITLVSTELAQTPAGRAATDLVVREWQRSREQRLNEFLARGLDVFPPEWIEATAGMTAGLRLTREQLAAFSEEISNTITETVNRYRNQRVPGARAVEVHFDAFPLIGEDPLVEKDLLAEEAPIVKEEESTS